MGYYHLHGIVLQSQDIRESDVAVTVLTVERGKTRFMVRGTKKIESSLRGAVEPFTEGHFFVAERRALDVLSEWERTADNYDIKKNMKRAILAGYFARYALELSAENEQDYSLYILFKNIFKLLQTELKNDIIKMLYEWGFLTIFGTAPEIGVCYNCGKMRNSEKTYWDIAGGGFYCGACRPMAEDALFPLSAKSAETGEAVSRAAVALTERMVRSQKALEKIVAPLSAISQDSGSTLEFSKGLIRFCRYHLREDIPNWLVKLEHASEERMK